MKKLIAIGLLSFNLLAIGGSVLAADADPYGLIGAGTSSGLSTRETNLPKAIGNYINVALSIIGIIFLILAIYGGFKIMFAQGDSSGVKEGRTIIVNAIIGMIVITLSYALTTFVFSNIIGAATP